MKISKCMFQCASVCCLCRFAMRLCCCAICMCVHTYVQQLINTYSLHGWNSCEGGIVCALTLVASVHVTNVLKQVCACTNKVCACGTSGPKSKPNPIAFAPHPSRAQHIAQERCDDSRVGAVGREALLFLQRVWDRYLSGAESLGKFAAYAEARLAARRVPWHQIRNVADVVNRQEHRPRCT